MQPPAGWTVVRRDDYVSMLAPTRDAELRVTTFSTARVRVPGDKWVGVVAAANRKLGRTLVRSEFGPFAGYAMETTALGKRIRAWFLHAGARPIVITYISPESVATRDDDVVAAALNSLSLADGLDAG